MLRTREKDVSGRLRGEGTGIIFHTVTKLPLIHGHRPIGHKKACKGSNFVFMVNAYKTIRYAIKLKN